MDLKLLIEIMAISDKLQIESNPNLTAEEKNFWKLFIDSLAKEAKEN